MKRCSAILILCLSALALATPAAAQEGFWLGVKGGYTIANADVSTKLPILQQQDSSGGIVVGIAAEGNLTGGLSFEGEIFYTERNATNVYFGGTGPGGTPLGDVTAEYEFEYLEIPAHFKYTFGTGSVRPYALLGTIIGVPLSIESTNTANGGSMTENAKSQFASSTWWLDAGLGLDFRVGSGTSILVEGRYNYSLSKASSESFDDWKWGDWRVLAGVKFRM